MKNIFKKNPNLPAGRHGFKIIIPAILLIVIAFGLIVPGQAHAWNPLDDAAKSIVTTVATAINWFLGWLVKAGASIFEGALNIGFTSTLSVIKIGWTACRDFANMLFILFMIIIAFATILRIENYGIKKLLPKVILVALLINFSMVFASAIIDVSNITANAFIKDIRGKLGSISGVFGDTVDITSTQRFLSCDQWKTKLLKDCEIFKLGPSAITDSFTTCTERANKQVIECEHGRAEPPEATQAFLDIVLNYTAAGILLIMAAFTFFAGAIMLLFRIIAIWFLVIISPLAFMCHILPSLEVHWKKWWSKFLNWCIFAPAYAFFIWMAMQIASSKNLEAIKAEAGTSGISGYTGSIASSFVMGPGQILIQSFLVVGFLIGGIIVAQQLGIAGANATMKIAQGVKKGATNWAKRTATRPVKTGGRLVGATAMGLGGKLFKGTTLGRRMQAKSAQIKQSAVQSAENKKYVNLLNTMTDENIEKEIMSAMGARKLIAVQTAKKRGILRETDRAVAEQSMKTMRAYGDEEGARSLEELRPDAIKNPAKKKEAIERAIKEGTHKKWSEKVFEAPEGAEVLRELQEQLGTGEFAKIFKGWAKNIQKIAEETMISEFTNDFTNADNLKKRENYAKTTGKVREAFLSDNEGTIQLSYFASAEPVIKTHIQGLNDEGFGNLKTDEDKKLAAMYMKASQVFGAGTKLSGQDKELIKAMAKISNPAAYAEMLSAKNWTT